MQYLQRARQECCDWREKLCTDRDTGTITPESRSSNSPPVARLSQSYVGLREAHVSALRLLVRQAIFECSITQRGRRSARAQHDSMPDLTTRPISATLASPPPAQPLKGTALPAVSRHTATAAAQQIGVLSVALDRWSPRWNSRHQVLTRLARQFPVLWLNPAPEWRRALITRQWRAREQSVPGLPRDFIVRDSSELTPLIYRPRSIGHSCSRARLHRARASLERRGCTRIVLYLWHVSLQDALVDVRHDLSIYHIYDEYSHAELELPLDPAEERLVRAVGQVFTVSPTMQARKGVLNPHSAQLSNGVDYEAFATPAPEPADLRPIPHPRIGYAGYIKKQLDWDLMLTLACRRPEWSFVFVGARTPHPEIAQVLAQLETLPNVYFLGAKATSELAAYPQHFDVCVMPYRVNDYTKYIYPLKLHEYLASGQPVVTVPLPALRGLEDLVEFASGTEMWDAAIARQLEPATMTGERRRLRQAEAQRHDWSVIAERIATIIRERVDVGTDRE